MFVRRTAPQEVKSKIIEHSPAKSKQISEYEEKKKVQLCTEGGDCLQDIHVKKGNVVKWVHKELILEASDPTPEKPIEPQPQEPEKPIEPEPEPEKPIAPQPQEPQEPEQVEIVPQQHSIVDLERLDALRAQIEECKIAPEKRICRIQQVKKGLSSQRETLEDYTRVRQSKNVYNPQHAVEKDRQAYKHHKEQEQEKEEASAKLGEKENHS